MLPAVLNRDIQPYDWTTDKEKIELVKRTIAKDATNDELSLFMAQCRRTALDPFARQIYAVKRWDSREGRNVMQVQVSIDGFRLIAERTGEYQGQTEPQWCGADGAWRDVWLADEPPAAARVGVLRQRFTHPIYSPARYWSYVQMTKEGRPNSMWAKMPDVMLAKCAEALALRKAFPQELSGLYTGDEMDQADNPPVGSQAAADAVAERKIAETGKSLDQAKRTEPADDTPIEVVAMWQEMSTKKGICSVFARLKKDLIELGAGEQAYYTVLGRHGIAHSNEFRSYRAARAASREIWDMLQKITNPPIEAKWEASDDDLPPEMLVASRPQEGI